MTHSERPSGCIAIPRPVHCVREICAVRNAEARPGLVKSKTGMVFARPSDSILQTQCYSTAAPYVNCQSLGLSSMWIIVV
jgi:hypothetical protein